MASRKKTRSAAITAVPTRERETVSIRRIENGYLINHCSYGKNGDYKEVERFSAEKPNLKVPTKESSRRKRK